MPLPRPASPRALWSDLRAFARERSKHQWIAAFFAVVMPVIIIIGFIVDSRTNIDPGEQLIFVESWSGNRTDEEIIAAQKLNEEKRQAIAAERQRQFKEVEKRLGI